MVQNEISQLTNSLRQQLEVIDSAGKGARNFESSFELHDDLALLLDLLAEQAPTADAADFPVAEDLLSTIDGSLAQWQAKISLSYAQGASRELTDHLKQVNKLQDALRERERELEIQRKEIEELAGETLKRQASVSRQRKSIAQALRARKAEMLLQLQSQRDAILARARELTPDSQHTSTTDNSLALKAQLLSVQGEMDAQQARHTAAQAQVAKLQGQLKAALGELEALRETNALLKPLTAELQAARHRMAALESNAVNELDRNSPLAELEARLEAAELEIQDLLEQNSDLASQLAKQQVSSSGHTPHVNFDQSLSWEERKKLILRQLENESADSPNEDGSDVASQNRMEIQQILNTTQSEIEKRDRQIAELQSIIEQQSDTRQGVAIGAAAFAQAFDNDELIQLERQKLKEIQCEWEEKLRQAEIDLSMERAKLARERSQLEADLSAKPEVQPTGEYLVQPQKRKWLEHLGLKDDNRADRT